MKKLIALLITLSLVGCGGTPPPDWNNTHKAYYKAHGFNVEGYQGYSTYPFTIGRCHWYTLSRGDTLYQSCLGYWNGETHEYNLKAINALEGK